jgi:hypothetical protein
MKDHMNTFTPRHLPSAAIARLVRVPRRGAMSVDTSSVVCIAEVERVWQQIGVGVGHMRTNEAGVFVNVVRVVHINDGVLASVLSQLCDDRRILARRVVMFLLSGCCVGVGVGTGGREIDVESVCDESGVQSEEQQQAGGEIGVEAHCLLLLNEWVGDVNATGHYMCSSIRAFFLDRFTSLKSEGVESNTSKMIELAF